MTGSGYDWVSFTTDYGRRDGFVAACAGVIARIAPQVRIVDVTHDVAPGDVRRGATVLAQTAGYLPPAVHLAVVDPGVGTGRRGLAVVAGSGILVGPDNGLLPPAADALGGIRAAHELRETRYWLPVTSRTFHGRDVFAPVVAHLANGLDPAALGPPVAVADLVRLPARRVSAAPGRLTAEVLTVDHFGNVQLAATAAHLTAAGLAHGHPVTITVGKATEQALGAGRATVGATVGGTFADVAPGRLVVLVDSAGQVAIAVNGASAAERLAATADATVTVAVVTVVTVESRRGSGRPGGG